MVNSEALKVCEGDEWLAGKSKDEEEDKALRQADEGEKEATKRLCSLAEARHCDTLVARNAMMTLPSTVGTARHIVMCSSFTWRMAYDVIYLRHG